MGLASSAGHPECPCKKRWGVAEASGTKFVVQKETGYIICMPECVKERDDGWGIEDPVFSLLVLEIQWCSRREERTSLQLCVRRDADKI